jgi:ArsR family transcriptional regulator
MQDALRQFKAEFFQALAHPTRIAIVEQLRDGELSAGALIQRLGIEQANASQHLAVLRAKNILISRKSGNQVFYAVRDPLIIEVLDVMRRYFHVHMGKVLATLKAIDESDRADESDKAEKADKADKTRR